MYVFFGEMSMQVFSLFLSRLFVFGFGFLLFNCMSSLYVLDINPLSETVCKYFFPFCKFISFCLFTLLVISFAVWKFLLRCSPTCLFLLLSPVLLVSCPKKSSLRPMSRNFSLYFLLIAIWLQELQLSL